MANTLRSVLYELGRLGTAQNRTIYARHGVGPDMFGVSFANLGKLKKSLGTNHELARGLWATGNHDARVLATKIADPALFSSRELDVWVKDLDNYIIADAFSQLVEKTVWARKKMDSWGAIRGEWTGRVGWLLVARLAMRDPTLSDEELMKKLATIEREIHSRKNRTRDAMNAALIAIGLRNPSLQTAALEVAQRIGTVDVDHGETGCTTPDAASSIARAAARKKTPRQSASRE
jgi:3-methyladenine DNA glycosylase AlkD